MDVFAHPLTILAACALTLVGALLLYFSVRREMAALRAGLAAEKESRTAALAEFRHALEQLEERMEAELQEALVRAAPPQQSMNLSRRSQALRMHRLGDPPEKIARTLGLSRTEVELLLKVHRTVLESLGDGARMRIEYGSGAGAQPSAARPDAGVVGAR
ncbi:MAG: hypothetical protein ACPL7M_05870, partial [Bryobacteraceae bacterium]